MDRQREKRLPPTPSSPRAQGFREGLGSPLGEGTYSHPRAAPAPPATSSTAVYSPTAPSFPLNPLPGLRTSCDQQQPQPQSRPRPQSRAPLRPAPWRTPTSPQRPPPGRLFDRALLSANPQRPAQKTSRSGSLPSIHYSNTLVEQQSPRSPRAVTPHPRHGVRSPPREFARSAIPSVPLVTLLPAAGFQLHQRQPSSTFSPPIPEKSPRRSQVGHNSTTKKRSTVSRELDVLEEQLVGLRVGEARKGEYHGNHGERRRRESTNSIYSQGSVYAETYHGFMFGDHAHREPSQGHLNRPEREGDNKQNRREPHAPQLFSPTRTTPRTPSPPPLESHYMYRRPNTPIAPSPIESRAARLEGRHRGEVEPTSPTPVRTLTATRITRKPAKLRPLSTQQVVRTPSPLSGTLKGPGPHVPDVNGDDTGSGSDGGAGAPMFARELTASPEVMSSVAAEEDERRGMVSRWSTDSSDLSDSSDEEVMDVEVSPVSGSPTREAGQEPEEPAKEPSEEYHEGHHEGQEVARLTPSAQDSSSSSEPSPSTQEDEGAEQHQNDEEPILPFNNLTTQFAALQASLNQLVSQATSVETAFSQVREAMIALRQKTTETLVDTQHFLEEIGRVEEGLVELRRQVKGKAKEVVGNGEDNQEQGMREDSPRKQGEGDGNHKGHEKEQDRERDTKKEGQQAPAEPQEGPPKGPPKGLPKPRRGPPSGPAPGGAAWV